MNSIFNMTATEIKNVLTEKSIQHEYVVGEYNHIWIGFRVKTQYNWICLINEKSIGLLDAHTYSQNTGKTAKGFKTRQKVYNRFEKLINK